VWKPWKPPNQLLGQKDPKSESKGCPQGASLKTSLSISPNILHVWTYCQQKMPYGILFWTMLDSM
jgi:hypothetical protein